MQRIALLLSALFISATVCAASLTNGTLQLDFASAENGFGVGCSCTDFGGSDSGVSARWADRPRPATFWTLRFRAGASNAASEIVLNNRSVCRARRLERTADGGAVFIWEGLDLGAEKAAVTVRARVAFPVPNESAWTLEVQNASAAYGLFETRYPEIGGFVPQGTDLLLPRQDLGARFIRNASLDRAYRFGCMGYHPMMLARFVGSQGLYFAAHDSQARIKTLTLSKKGDAAFVTPIENGGIPGKAAEGPRYAVTLAALEGDWWAAAKRYRAWALTAPWTAKGPIVTRADYPRQLAETPLWLNTHAHPAEVSNTLTRAAQVFPGVPIGLHWHLWQHSGHDVNYPEYFPEQPGTREAIAYCHAIGTEPMPYTNGRLWSTNLMSFALARPYAITQANGSPVIEQYGKLTPPMAPMCPATAMWDAMVNDFAGRVLSLGAKSLFLDQIGACPGKPCYNPNHGHPIGGGIWYYEGYQALLAKTHATYAAKGAYLTTEGSGEQWMNVIDGYLNVTRRQPDDVPFFHAVYSGYTTYFCSPENNHDDPKSFWAAQARELVWGQSLGWFHPEILEDSEKCEFLRRLIAFRQQNLDCLAYGTMEAPIRFLGPVPTPAGSVPSRSVPSQSASCCSQTVLGLADPNRPQGPVPTSMGPVPSRSVPSRSASCCSQTVLGLAEHNLSQGPVPVMPVTWLGRKSFFLWSVKEAPLSPTVTGVVSAVEGIVWRSAKTGRRVAILANLSDKEQTVRFRFEQDCPACKGEDALATRGGRPLGTDPVVEGTDPVVEGTGPAVEGTDPVVEGTDPVVEGTDPASEGTGPAVEGTDPVVEGTGPAVEGTDPAVEGTDPAVEGTDPVVEGTDPAVEGTDPVVEGTDPASVGTGPKGVHTLVLAPRALIRLDDAVGIVTHESTCTNERKVK